VIRFVGGPADGKEYGEALPEGISIVEVPFLGRDIDRYVKRENRPRRKPRGLWSWRYRLNPDDPTILSGE
jgi:nitric oxide synthase oxygenase domain/subunit